MDQNQPLCLHERVNNMQGPWEHSQPTGHLKHWELIGPGEGLKAHTARPRFPLDGTLLLTPGQSGRLIPWENSRLKFKPGSLPLRQAGAPTDISARDTTRPPRRDHGSSQLQPGWGAAGAAMRAPRPKEKARAEEEPWEKGQGGFHSSQHMVGLSTQPWPWG